MGINQIKIFFLEIFFPKFCLGCQREGDYLCPDCKATLEISEIHQSPPAGGLKDLYFALDYQKPLIKKSVKLFKYEPFVKELAKPLSSLIIEHFLLLEKQPDFGDFILIPIPLEKKKMKWRGFNQAEEIGKELSKFLKIPLLNNILLKTRETLPQVELTGKERKENMKGAFLVQNNDLIKNKKILLVDDIYTTGSTMKEAARVLKEAGGKEIIGIAVARASPEDDSF